MPSPFPGMDPYLEDPNEWGEVHLRLIAESAKQLNQILPDGFRAKIDQYVRIEDQDQNEERNWRRNPDVFIPAPFSPGAAFRNGHSMAVLEAPTVETVLLPGPVVKHRRLLIQSADGRNILTAIELLSPSNKTPGKDRDSYLAKRSEFLGAGTNLVEIDLLRGGNRLPFGRPHPPTTDYYILVSATERRPTTSIWAFSVRQPMPVFGIPLSSELGHVPLDLNRCLASVYEDGRYSLTDYSKPAVPPLNALDADWASSLHTKPAKKKKK